jgi:hypothetical protein
LYGYGWFVVFHLDIKKAQLPDKRAVVIKMGRAIKAKDTPWDAVLMGSVACTVDANITQYLIDGSIRLINS